MRAFFLSRKNQSRRISICIERVIVVIVGFAVAFRVRVRARFLSLSIAFGRESGLRVAPACLYIGFLDGRIPFVFLISYLSGPRRMQRTHETGDGVCSSPVVANDDHFIIQVTRISKPPLLYLPVLTIVRTTGSRLTYSNESTLLPVEIDTL